MSFRETLLCAVLGATTSSVVALAAEPMWRGDFETGDLSQWSSKLDIQAGTTDRLVVVTDRVREGRYALRATVKPGDLNNNGARAEVVLARPQFREGDERWFHWYTMFPADFVTSDKWMLWTQWHSNGFGNPMGFTLRGETLRFRVMGWKYDLARNWTGGVLWTAPLHRGSWNEYLLHVKFSENAKVGFVELWVNGAPVVPKTMHQTLDSGDTAYLKMGFYRDRAITWNQSVYHDGMRVYAEDPRVADTVSISASDPLTQPSALDNPAAIAGEKPGGCGSENAPAAALIFPAPMLLRFFRRRGGLRRGAQ